MFVPLHMRLAQTTNYKDNNKVEKIKRRVIYFAKKKQ